jgi:hypothetical protein
MKLEAILLSEIPVPSYHTATMFKIPNTLSQNQNENKTVVQYVNLQALVTMEKGKT